MKTNLLPKLYIASMLTLSLSVSHAQTVEWQSPLARLSQNQIDKRSDRDDIPFITSVVVGGAIIALGVAAAVSEGSDGGGVLVAASLSASAVAMGAHSLAEWYVETYMTDEDIDTLIAQQLTLRLESSAVIQGQPTSNDPLFNTLLGSIECKSCVNDQAKSRFLAKMIIDSRSIVDREIRPNLPADVDIKEMWQNYLQVNLLMKESLGSENCQSNLRMMTELMAQYMMFLKVTRHGPSAAELRH